MIHQGSIGECMAGNLYGGLFYSILSMAVNCGVIEKGNKDRRPNSL